METVKSNAGRPSHQAECETLDEPAGSSQTASEISKLPWQRVMVLDFFRVFEHALSLCQSARIHDGPI